MIRLQRFSDLSLAPSGQWAYRTDPSHGAADLASLPDGRLLVLERSYSGSRHNAIYLVNFFGATDTSAILDLDDEPFALVSKTLLWQGYTGISADFEGISVGPQLGDGSYSLLLIADNGVGTQQHLHALTVQAPEPATTTLLLSATAILSRRRNRRPL